MNKRLLQKKIGRLMGRIFVFFCLFVIRFFPENTVYYFSKFIARLAYLIDKKHRNLALKNLRLAFLDKKNEAELKQIVLNLFQEIAWGTVETTRLSYLRPGEARAKIKKNISISGTNYLDKALSKKKGLILISAHFGNFSLITYRLSQAGYPSNMLVRDANDPAITKIWYDALDRLGIEYISAVPRNKAAVWSLRWLRENKVLCLFADQNKTKGVYVDFFKRPAGTVEGPAFMSLHSGAPILCAFMLRLSKDKHQLIITPPLDIELSNDEGKNIHNITQAYTKVIEDFVNKYPDQWWWLHNRWKAYQKLKQKS